MSSHACPLHRPHVCPQTHNVLCSGHPTLWFASLSTPLLRNLSSTLMLIGVDVLTPVVRPLAIVCFLVTNSFPGFPNDNPRFFAPVQKLSTRVLLMWFLNRVGFAIFSYSFTTHFPMLLWCTLIMLVPSTSLVIQCSINVLNILRWTFSLFEKRSCVARHSSFMFLLVIRLLTSSPKAFLEFFLMISEPV